MKTIRAKIGKVDRQVWSMFQARSITRSGYITAPSSPARPLSTCRRCPGGSTRFLGPDDQGPPADLWYA